MLLKRKRIRIFPNFFCFKSSEVAERYNFIPIIDMKIFKQFIMIPGKFKNKNIWDLFFEKKINFKLDEVYKSKM